MVFIIIFIVFPVFIHIFLQKMISGAGAGFKLDQASCVQFELTSCCWVRILAAVRSDSNPVDFLLKNKRKKINMKMNNIHKHMSQLASTFYPPHHFSVNSLVNLTK